jgi:hypothetical protein
MEDYNIRKDKKEQRDAATAAGHVPEHGLLAGRPVCILQLFYFFSG